MKIPIERSTPSWGHLFFKPRWLCGLFVIASLSGCGAMWDQWDPPIEERDKLAFHLARTEPYADWQLRTGPLGNPRVYIQKAALFTASEIELAAPMVDKEKQYFVGIKLRPQAADRLSMATKQSVGASIALLKEARLVSVMPVDAPITMGTFAIRVKDVNAAYELSKLLSGEQLPF